MHITKEMLFSMILDAVKKGCEENGITRGAIAVAVEPTRWDPATEEWCGANVGDISMKIDTIGDGSILRNGNEETVECAGVVAMKIMSCRKAIEIARDEFNNNFGAYCSEAAPECCNIYGRINWEGAIAVPIGKFIGGFCGHAGIDVMTIYIAVSGAADGKDDKAAALKGLQPIFDVIRKEPPCTYMIARFVEDFFDDMQKAKKVKTSTATEAPQEAVAEDNKNPEDSEMNS